MPDGHALPFRERLARDLSDLAVATEGRRAPIDVAIHTHFVAMADLPPPPDDPLRRRDDPMAGIHRELMAGAHGNFSEVEPVLLKWLRASPDRAERFAEDPATVVSELPGLKPEDKARLARYFGRRASRAVPRLAGFNVKEMTFDAKPVVPPVAPALLKTGEIINADALFQVGFSQLQRIFAETMLPPIRQAASEISFLTGPAGGLVAATARLLVERTGDPQLELQTDGTLKLTIGFAITQLEIPPLSLGSVGTNVDLGAVTLEAKLNLSTTDTSAGADLNLTLATNGLTISSPPGLTTLLTPAWDAAKARIAQIVSPLFAFPVPLQFPPAICGITPRKVKAGLLPKDPAENTQESLALAIALLDTTDASMLDVGQSSRVKDGEDGAIFLSNHLLAEVACCILTQSSALAGLPPPNHEATEAEPYCRWENIPNFRLGEEVFDKLVYLQIGVADGGISTELQAKKSGTGWSVTATITADTKLNLTNGVMTATAATHVDIHKHIAWWVKFLAVLSIIGGVALIVVGLITGNVPLVVIGVSLLEFGLVLGAIVIVLGALLTALTPSQLADANQFIGLLPTGLTAKFGNLSFLTALDWDDLEFGGYMALPGSPSIVAGGDVVLQPGSAIDLDTGEIIGAADINARMDADLLLHIWDPVVASSGTLAREAPQIGTGSSRFAGAPANMRFMLVPDIDLGEVAVPLRGRKLEALGATRLVLLGSRPYGSVGYSDLAQLGFPQSATAIDVPAVPAQAIRPVMRTFGARTSAGRLASCAVWTQRSGQVNLRYRTYDTPVWLSIDANIYIQSFGKSGRTAELFILNGTFDPVPGPQWPSQPLTSYRWYWSGIELVGSGVLDPAGNNFAILGDRCQIVTAEGADLKGWLCVVASTPSGLETSACRNITHIGRFDLPPGGSGSGFGGPGGGPGSGEPGGGGPGGGGFPGGPPTL